MIFVQLQQNLDAFNARLKQYIEVTGKTPVEAVKKQSTKLGYALTGRLNLLKPAKGSIMASQLARVRSDRSAGFLVRPSVRLAIASKFSARSNLSTHRQQLGRSGMGSVKRGGKRLNLQALMVQKELKLREGGRGYLGFIGRLRGIGNMQPFQEKKWFGRYRQLVADAGLQVRGSHYTAIAEMELGWSDQPGEEGAKPGTALSTPAAQQALAGALAEIDADMKIHIDDLQAKAAAKLNEQLPL